MLVLQDSSVSVPDSSVSGAGGPQQAAETLAAGEGVVAPTRVLPAQSTRPASSSTEAAPPVDVAVPQESSGNRPLALAVTAFLALGAIWMASLFLTRSSGRHRA